VASFEKTSELLQPNTFKVFISESNKNDDFVKFYTARIVSSFEEIGFSPVEKNPRYNINILFTQNSENSNHKLGLLLTIVDNMNKTAVFKYQGFVVDREITTADYLCLIDSLFSKDIKTKAISFDSLTSEFFDKSNVYPCS